MSHIEYIDQNVFDKIVRWLPDSSSVRVLCKSFNQMTFHSGYLNDTMFVVFPYWIGDTDAMFKTLRKWGNGKSPSTTRLKFTNLYDFTQVDYVFDEIVRFENENDTIAMVEIEDPLPSSIPHVSRFSNLVHFNLRITDYVLSNELMLQSLVLPSTCRFFGIRYTDPNNPLVMEFPVVLPTQTNVKFLELEDVSFDPEDIACTFPNLKVLSTNWFVADNASEHLKDLRGLVLTSSAKMEDNIGDMYRTVPNIEMLAIFHFGHITFDEPVIFDKLSHLFVETTDYNNLQDLFGNIPECGTCFPNMTSFAAAMAKGRNTFVRRHIPEQIENAYVFVDAPLSIRWIGQSLDLRGNRIVASKDGICVEASFQQNSDLLSKEECANALNDRDLMIHELDFVRTPEWCRTMDFKTFVSNKFFD